jgi:arginine decarboxylase-like protein
MQRVWSNRNVDLNLFKEKIREFFEKNDFEVVIDESESLYHITANGSSNYQIEGHISVTLEGTPEDFSIRLEQQKSREKKYSLPITLAASLGFGLLLREEFKSDEAFTKLRRDLWAFADRAVINLTGSAQASHDTCRED